jgi:hypothetical protein
MYSYVLGLEMTYHPKTSLLLLAIRIRSGKVDDTFMGHVEVNVDKSEIWKKIFRNWTMNDANVVCKEAGHGKALEYINKTDYSRRKSLNDTIFPADDANVKRYELKGNCSGSEYSILRCGAGKLATEHTIAADAGVGVRCQIPGKKHYITPVF